MTIKKFIVMLLNSLRFLHKGIPKRNISTVSSHVDTSKVLTPECLDFIETIHVGRGLGHIKTYDLVAPFF